jgi:hypothetical protein
MLKKGDSIMGKEKQNSVEEKVVEDKFTKKQFLSSKLFKNNKDVLNVVIKDDEELSIKEAKERIENFMKGKVK